jgi:alanine dehydrogenase
MRIGVPREIKDHEYRVGLAPGGVRELVQRGHEVLVERSAGHAMGLDDVLYEAAGARVAKDASTLYETCELIIKVKEPQPAECRQLRPGQTLFTYLHLAADPELTRLLIASGCTAIAYETVTDARGRLPLLAPMSEVAGRMSIQAGAHCLEMVRGGRGVLLAGVPGVASGHVVVLGGGVVGSNAARIAMGFGARVTLLDHSLPRLQELEERYGSRLHTLYANRENIESAILEADLVIGAVLLPGASAPKLVGRELVRDMRRGSVVVDVSIDQGGCFATSRPTTHAEPTYVVDEVVHYCVTNMPGAVARTSTLALTNATLPFVIELADRGTELAVAANAMLATGLNLYRGMVTHPAVAASLGQDYVPVADAVREPAGVRRS